MRKANGIMHDGQKVDVAKANQENLMEDSHRYVNQIRQKGYTYMHTQSELSSPKNMRQHSTA